MYPVNKHMHYKIYIIIYSQKIVFQKYSYVSYVSGKKRNNIKWMLSNFSGAWCALGGPENRLFGFFVTMLLGLRS